MSEDKNKLQLGCSVFNDKSVCTGIFLGQWELIPFTPFVKVRHIFNLFAAPEPLQHDGNHLFSYHEGIEQISQTSCWHGYDGTDIYFELNLIKKLKDNEEPEERWFLPLDWMPLEKIAALSYQKLDIGDPTENSPTLLTYFHSANSGAVYHPIHGSCDVPANQLLSGKFKGIVHPVRVELAEIKEMNLAY